MFYSTAGQNTQKNTPPYQKTGTIYFYEGDKTTYSHLHWRDLQRIFLKK